MKKEKTVLEALAQLLEEKLKEKKRLVIEVKPNAKEITFSYDETKAMLFLSLKEPAQENRANKALVQLLKKVTKRQVTIVQGATTRKKIVEFF